MDRRAMTRHIPLLIAGAVVVGLMGATLGGLPFTLTASEGAIALQDLGE